MKKIITMLLAVILIGTLAVPAHAAGFSAPWVSYFSGWKSWFAQAEEKPDVSEPEVSEEPVIEETAPPVEVEKATYTIRYDANGGYFWSQYASPAISNSKEYAVDAGKPHTIFNAPCRTGYIFLGWEDQDSTIYQPGDKITPTADLYIKAKWCMN